MTAKPSKAKVARLVLRFRDLALPPGDTVRLHAQLIGSKGFVWWGWWNKSGEIASSHGLGQLEKDLAKHHSVKVLLFDSGHLQLRYVTCTEIKRRAIPTPSPSKPHTPKYYSNQNFLAWFKFTAIEEPLTSPDEELHKYSYLCMDDSFRDGDRYTPFHDKRVGSTTELKQQDRTMWFLRAFAKGDHTQEISLISGFSVSPSHFPEAYRSSPSQNLLWVSDLHFGPKHNFPKASTATKPDLGQALDDALKRLGFNDLSGVVVSGDITWQSSPAEFEDAVKFIGRLSRSPSALDTYAFAICPGNHDLAFSPTPAVKTAEVTAAPEAARRNYADFYERLFFIAPNEHLSMGRRILLGRHFPVEIACLNTSVLEQAPGWFQGHGFVGEAQLNQVAQQFGWLVDEDKSRPSPFRIVVLHHHLVPVVYAEEPRGDTSYSVVLDAERIVRWLVQYRVDLVLHGHMHERFYTKLLRRTKAGAEHCIHIAGMGSTGVDKSHRGEDVPNTFAVLAAKHAAIQLSFFSVFPGSGEPKLLDTIEIGRT